MPEEKLTAEGPCSGDLQISRQGHMRNAVAAAMKCS